MEKRLKTIMIGAIHLFQVYFKEELKDEEFNRKFLLVREKILDLGNRQIYLFEKYEKEQR